VGGTDVAAIFTLVALHIQGIY